jgi:hypothetical protein
VIGVRVADGKMRSEGTFIPGAYGRVERDGEWVWLACTPNGMLGDLSEHDVEEHEDGTITVSPSVETTRGHVRPARGEIDVEDGERYWHGFLERGVWRS